MFNVNKVYLINDSDLSDAFPPNQWHYNMYIIHFSPVKSNIASVIVRPSIWQTSPTPVHCAVMWFDNTIMCSQVLIVLKFTLVQFVIFRFLFKKKKSCKSLCFVQMYLLLLKCDLFLATQSSGQSNSIKIPEPLAHCPHLYSEPHEIWTKNV